MHTVRTTSAHRAKWSKVFSDSSYRWVNPRSVCDAFLCDVQYDIAGGVATHSLVLRAVSAL